MTIKSLTEDQKNFLIDGELESEGFPFNSWAEAKRLWKRHKTEIIEEAKKPRERIVYKYSFVCVQNYLFPWAWWRWEAKEPRIQISGSSPPSENTEACWRSNWGAPSLWKNGAHDVYFENDLKYAERLKIRT